jgi:hypothetical protein
MAMVKVRNSCHIEECETMNICQGVGNIFIVAIDGTNSVHIFEST